MHKYRIRRYLYVGNDEYKLITYKNIRTNKREKFAEYYAWTVDAHGVYEVVECTNEFRMYVIQDNDEDHEDWWDCEKCREMGLEPYLHTYMT